MKENEDNYVIRPRELERTCNFSSEVSEIEKDL